MNVSFTFKQNKIFLTRDSQISTVYFHSSSRNQQIYKFYKNTLVNPFEFVHLWFKIFSEYLFHRKFSKLKFFSFNFVVYTPWGGYGVAAGCGPCDKPEPNCPFIASGHSISSYFPIYSEQHIFQIVSLCIQYSTDSHFLIVSYFLSQCTHS